MLKVLFLAIVAISVCLSPNVAEGETVIRLSADGAYYNFAFVPYPFSSYVAFDVFIFADLEANERVGVRFALVIPDNLVIGASCTYNSDVVQSAEGSIINGADILFNDCYSGWHMLCYQTFITTNTEQSDIHITAHENGGMGYYTCIEHVLTPTCYSPLAINYEPAMSYAIPICPTISVENTSWGVIKSLYVE